MLKKLICPVLASLAFAEIVELQTGDDIIEEMTNDHEFAIVSFFYPSQEKSAETNSYMLGAQTYMNDMIEKGEWTKRDVGWFSVDNEAHPDLKLTDEPNQMLISKSGRRRFINFGKMDEEKSENERVLANIVKLLTGDWIEEIACDDIQSPERHNYDEVVYFGAKEDLLPDGKNY